MFIAGWKRTNSLPPDARQFVMVVKRSKNSGLWHLPLRARNSYRNFPFLADSSITLLERTTYTPVHGWSGDLLRWLHGSSTRDDKKGTDSGTGWEHSQLLIKFWSFSSATRQFVVVSTFSYMHVTLCLTLIKSSLREAKGSRVLASVCYNTTIKPRFAAFVFYILKIK